MDDFSIVVSVICTTYNHEIYIAQAIEGFVMQKATFTIEVIIHDDASTDKTADIIREYESRFPEIIKPIYQTVNGYGTGRNTKAIMQAAHGKYIAMCEGDDYWTDPYKLQKQVDFLEANLDYGLVSTLFRSDINNKVIIKSTTSIKLNNWKDISFQEMLLSNPIGTLTTMIRRDALFSSMKSLKDNSKNFSMGDYPLWLEIALKSKVAILQEYTANYRVLRNSASHSEDINKQARFYNDIFKIKHYYIEKGIREKDKKIFLKEAERDHKKRLFNLYTKHLQPQYLFTEKMDIFRLRLSKNILTDLVYVISAYCKPLRYIIRIYRKTK